jgi:hypothetical protein
LEWRIKMASNGGLAAALIRANKNVRNRRHCDAHQFVTSGLKWLADTVA